MQKKNPIFSSINDTLEWFSMKMLKINFIFTLSLSLFFGKLFEVFINGNKFVDLFYWPRFLLLLLFFFYFHTNRFVFSDLSHNKLSRIPTDAFSSLSNLTVLDLSYNKIQRMNPGTVVPWRNLHAFNISGNVHLDLYHLRLTFYVSFIEFYVIFLVSSNFFSLVWKPSHGPLNITMTVVNF